MGDNAEWARGMPWRFMGFGAAFIGALLAWHSQRGIPQAMAGQMMLGHDATLAVGDTLVEEPIERTITQRTPRQAPTEAADPGTDVTVVVSSETTTIEEQSFGVVVPAPEPHRLVVVVHQQPAQPAVVQPQRQTMKMVAVGGGPPRTVPDRPNLPRTPRGVMQSPRPPVRTPAVSRGGSSRMGGTTTVRRRPPRTRPRLR